jgi:hypothetical protein
MLDRDPEFEESLLENAALGVFIGKGLGGFDGGLFCQNDL